jgi:hypothetical protein
MWKLKKLKKFMYSCNMRKIKKLKIVEKKLEEQKKK